MHRLRFTKFVATSFLTLAFIVSCSKSPDTGSTDAFPTGLLEYVPADSPYVFANPEPLPDDVMDELEPVIASVLETYSSMIRVVFEEGMATAELEGKTEEEIEAINSIGVELASLLTLEGLRGAGIDRKSTSVIYGNGLLPVLRISLSDGELMASAIDRVEAKAGQKMATATVGNLTYRYVGDEDAILVVAVIDDALVVGLLPAEHSEELLKSTLGLVKPADNMADAGTLQKIASDNDYLSYMVMYMDITRIAETFIEEPSGANKEVLALMDYDYENLGDVCVTEIREMAAVMPRIVGGYTEFTARNSSAHFLIEMRNDIAAGLATLVAPVQGLGVTKADLFSFGMSLDVSAARNFYSARLDAMEADPFECEHFAELQGGVAQGRAMLEQPVPPIVYSIKGFFASVDDIEGLDMATKQPPTSIDASFLLAVDNPQGLLAMGQMFSPELAQLNVQTDGKPVRLELPPVSPALSEAFVAMTDNALAISLGADGEKRLGDLLSSGYAEPAPFMSMNMDGDSYYGFIAESMAVAELEREAKGEGSPELAAALADVMLSLQGLFGQMTFDVEFTDRGIEMRSTAEMLEQERQ